MKGVLHVHSTWSDGEFTLPELRDLFLAAGCRFACVSDHADAFDAVKRDAYVRECETLSDAAFRFIPSLEYGCVDRMHILGYGCTALIESTDPAAVIAGIRGADALAVIAHPKESAFEGIARLHPVPHGIEVWNSKYDGRFAPRPATFELLARVREREPSVRAYFGQDLHWRRQYRGLFVHVEVDRPDRLSVLDALRRGAFVGVKDDLTLLSSGRLTPAVEARFQRAQQRTRLVRDWVRRAKAVTDASGLRVPAAIKSQLRRIF